MAQRWSQRFHRDLGINFPPDVAEWFDRGMYDSPDVHMHGEFTDPIEPAQILDPTSAIVWGGQMLPDTLPILSNGCGDTLSLRFDRDGGVREVVRWNHEGCDWRPYGDTFFEALLCDVAGAGIEVMTFDGREHEGHSLDEPAAQWAIERLAPSRGGLDHLTQSGMALVGALLEAGIGEVYCRREMCRDSLTSGLESACRAGAGGVDVAGRLGVEWRDISSWMFDTSLIPERYLTKLCRLFGESTEQLFHQDWASAVGHARRVRQLRPDLSWPHGLIGRAAERSGDRSLAAREYLAGLESLGSSDDVLYGQGFKLVVERLRGLRDKLPDAGTESSYLRNALDAEHSGDFFERTRKYWLKFAAEAEQRHEYARAYTCYYSAGWDIHVLDYIESILEGLARTAAKAGYTALQLIAEHHLATLR